MAGTARQGGGLIRRSPTPAPDRRDRLLPRRLRRGLRPALGGPVPRSTSACPASPGSTRWSGSASSPRARHCSRSSSRSRSCIASPRMGPARMARALLVFDALRIVGLLAFAFAGSFAFALAAFWVRAARPLARSARPLDVAERERRGLERPRDRALDDERLRVGRRVGRRARARRDRQRLRDPGRARRLGGGARCRRSALYGRAIRHHGREPELAVGARRPCRLAGVFRGDAASDADLSASGAFFVLKGGTGSQWR